MTTIHKALSDGINRLKTGDNRDSARIDADVLLAFVLSASRTYLYTHALSEIDDEQHKQFCQYIEKRLTGMPVAYITGQREFWSLELDVNSNVLIPRPDTELLVELAVSNPAFASQAQENNSLEVLELGTGSGAIALAIASEKPHWHVTAIDICPHALAIARQNAKKHHLNHITFIESNWFDALPPQSRYDLIISNPPYIASDDVHLTQGDLRFEPRKALVATQYGLDCLFHIIRTSLARLASKGLLLLEHGFQQGAPVKAFFETCGFKNIVQYRDFQNHIRVTAGTFDPA